MFNRCSGCQWLSTTAQSVTARYGRRHAGPKQQYEQRFAQRILVQSAGRYSLCILQEQRGRLHLRVVCYSIDLKAETACRRYCTQASRCLRPWQGAIACSPTTEPCCLSPSRKTRLSGWVALATCRHVLLVYLSIWKVDVLRALAFRLSHTSSILIRDARLGCGTTTPSLTNSCMPRSATRVATSPPL